MVKHIVFFKLPKEFTQKDLLVEKLNNLKDEIDFIISLEVGVDFLQSERSFDIVLTVVVGSKEELSKYATDPKHLQVVDFIKSNGIETKVVDYEIAKQAKDGEFKNASIIKKANQYFDGQVTSRTVIELDGSKKTLGVMMPGTYTFGTVEAEHMEILAGQVEVKFPNSNNVEIFKATECFEVPANSSFDIKVLEVTDYCCTYIK